MRLHPSLCLFSALLIVLVFVAEARALTSEVTNEDISTEEMEEMLRRNPTFVLGMLTKLRSNLLKPVENTKRGIDFGLGRGYSGNQAAKHFMGLVASQYAGGPGKRKRSETHLPGYQPY